MVMKPALTATGWLLTLSLAVFFSSPVRAGEDALHDLEVGLNDLVYELSQTVVTVQASRYNPTSRLGKGAERTFATVVSSGIVCDSTGRVLVPAQAVIGCDAVMVTNGCRTVAAKLVAIDYQYELALLQCSPAIGKPVSYSSHQTCAGQMVVAMGHAFGVRTAPSIGFCAGVRDDGSMQFSVPTAETARGGGIFDLSGNLLGMISSGSGRGRDLTLAIPAYGIPGIVKHLATGSDRQSGFAGITTQEIEIRPALEIPHNLRLATIRSSASDYVERGLVVNSVVAKSPAARAGLAEGDLLYAVNGIAVNSAMGLANLVRQSTPGTLLMFDLLRHGQLTRVTLTVGRKSLQSLQSSAPVPVTSGERLATDSIREAVQIMKSELRRLEDRLRDLD